MVMGSAQGDGELVADLASQGPWLSKFEVMCISGGLLADQTTLAADESEVILASLPRWLFWEGETDLPFGRGVGRCMSVAGSLHRMFFMNRVFDR